MTWNGKSNSPKLHRSMILILWYRLVQKVKNSWSPLSQSTFFKYSPFSRLLRVSRRFYGHVANASFQSFLIFSKVCPVFWKAFVERVIERMIIIYGVQGRWNSLETILDDLIKFFSGVGVSLDKSIVTKSDSMLLSSRPKTDLELPSK